LKKVEIHQEPYFYSIRSIRRIKRFNPAHPGEIVRELCIEALGITVTEAAKGLGVTRKVLSELLNGHSRISPEMAIRLSIAFNTSAESWINQQAKYD
jgi:antitoxin HigA-1